MDDRATYGYLLDNYNFRDYSVGEPIPDKVHVPLNDRPIIPTPKNYGKAYYVSSGAKRVKILRGIAKGTKFVAKGAGVVGLLALSAGIGLGTSLAIEKLKKKVPQKLPLQ